MLDLSRYGPRDFSGKVTVYPVQWCVFAPIDSVLSRREGKLRIIYDRLKKALGEQWMHGVTVELDYHCYYEFLDGYSTQWADFAYASTSCNEIDIADWVNQMRELLEGFDPLWIDNRDYLDLDEDELPTIVNRRSAAENKAAEAEKEALLRELDDFESTL